MKKALSSILLTLILSVGFIVGCSGNESARPSPTPSNASAPAYTDSTGAISANGIVVPARHSGVGFQLGGQVKEVVVQTGDTVQAGQVLAQLEGVEQLTAAVTAAELELLNAQQARQSLQDNAPDDIAQTRLDLADFKKQLDDTRRTLRSLNSPDIKYYQDQVNDAQDALATALENVTLTDDGALQIVLRNAQEQMKKATDIYQDAKDALARCPLCTEVFVNAAGAMMEWKDVQKQYDDAQANLYQVQTQVAQAARQSSSSVATAQDNLDKAQRALSSARQAPDAVKVAQAQAQIARLETHIAQTETYLAKIGAAGIDPDKQAAAEARLKNAQAQLAAATTTLDQTTLRAPFAGTVTDVLIQTGEVAGVGMPVVELSDLQHWRVETKDIGELSIGRVKIGQPAKVTINAFFATELAGTVVAISPTAIVQLGDTTYAVTLELEPIDLALRWGMTTKVRILAGE